MANNELLRSIRDALGLDAATMIEIFRAAGREVGASAIDAFLKREDEDDYIPCSNPIMGFFLDGLIIHSRGHKEGSPTPAAQPLAELGNNVILKKLRIALDLKEEDMIGIFGLAGTVMPKHELTALFRKPGHKHYKECTDQLLRGFIKGVALRPKT
ncbi:MAG: DUF1456 family protein [Geobacter sp.]|nr:DUF1456 family protein [Geobacter sp.]